MNEWTDSIQPLSPEIRETLYELLTELDGHSSKALSACLSNWKPAGSRLPGPDLLTWVDLGVAISGQSAAAAIKYFKESPEWLAALPADGRTAVLEQALDLADRNYGVVTDFLKSAPAVLSVLPQHELEKWIGPVLNLADADIVLAVEYIRISPAILNFLSPSDLEAWVGLGMRLVVPNQFGKPDYIRAIEFFRLSPVVFSAVSPPELRRPLIDIAVRQAAVSPQRAVEFIQSGAELLPGIPSPAARRRVLEQALRLADLDPDVLEDYFKQAPRTLEAVGDNLADFDRWVDKGLELLAQSVEKARAFFSHRSRTGQETTESLAGGLALSQVGRILKLYAEGLSGHPVAIRSTADLPPDLREPGSARPTTDGRAIFLPERIRYFSDPADNFRFYKVASLHEIGHLEFGTYDFDFAEAAGIAEQPARRYGKSLPEDGIRKAEDFFSLYPDSGWARRLWEILEDARTDFLLRAEYPGVRPDMDFVIDFELKSRPALDGLPPRHAVREALQQLSLTDQTDVPMELAPLVSSLYNLLLKLKHPAARPLDSLAVLDEVYPVLDEWLGRLPAVEGETDPLRARDQNAQEEAGENQSGEKSIQPDSFSFRGSMHPEWVTEQRREDGDAAAAGGESGGKEPSGLSTEAGVPDGASSRGDRPEQDSPPVADGSAIPGSQAGRPGIGRIYYYDEWDEAAQDYRPRWTRLIERPMERTGGSFTEETVARYGGAVKLLRRYFETLKPEAFKKLKRRTDGEEMDLDALLEAKVEILAGQTPTDRVYVRSEKKQRNVAVVFLLDLSGSTSRYIGKTGKRIIDIEKESLVLLSEALEAVGDDYAIFGFSGQGHDQVDFYILKDFAEFGPRTLAGRIGSVRPMAQNRDGAAIRHAVHKLLLAPARTRLLVLLSDGKPLDNDYAAGHALHDTKRALREARNKGVHPYCITIDREGSQYLSDMYGEVRYTIIDNVLSLPNRLPQIYRRLTA
jgi:nitric oxide reductase NorD protein